MQKLTGVFTFAVMLGTFATAHAADWQLDAAKDASGAVLTVGAGKAVSYRFECAADAIIATEIGVTELIDLKTGTPVGDGPQAVMPPGAAIMALFAGKGRPQFVPAEAVKNPAGGWNLTIRLAKDDSQVKAVGKSDMMSLFTTGYTMAVVMDAESRAKWNQFVQRCQSPA